MVRLFEIIRLKLFLLPQLTLKNMSNPYLKYSSMTFQMMGIIAIMAYIGHLLDNFIEIKFPAFMLFFCLMGIAGALYQVIKSLPKE